MFVLPYLCANFYDMTNRKKNMRSVVLSLCMTIAMLPTGSYAQETEKRGGGLFGFGAKVADDWFGDRSFFNIELEDGIYNQTYGSDQDGFGITNQTYGQNEEAPLGSGLLMMTAAAMGYAAMKRNKKQTKK